MNYEQVLPGVHCDLSLTSLEEAMIKICAKTTDGKFERSPMVYELYVHPDARIDAGRLLESCNLVNVGRTPLRIHIELFVNDNYQRHEWSLRANNHSVGSRCVP